jgi:prepilin-type N-terminal cleavage/methylation domain-containing protein
MLSNNQKHFRKSLRNAKFNNSGFSLIELIIVVLLISIVSVFTLMSFRGEKRYLADSQAYQIIDILHEARQRSLTQHQTIRVEINQKHNIIRLVSENEPSNANDDKELKSIKLQNPSQVVVGRKPKNVSASPTEMSPVPVLSFKKSVHPLSKGEEVLTLRYVRTGKILDAGSNPVGDNSVVTGATIYVWMPEYNDAGQPLDTASVIRAITVQGTSGISKYLKCPVEKGKCKTWTQ